MTFGPKDLAKLLERTDLKIPFEEFIKVVGEVYNLGKIYSYAPILEGYEDANIRLSAEKGEYVLKIFAREKTFDQVKSYADVLQEAKKRKLPLTELEVGNQGYLSTFTHKNTTIYYYLTIFFHGKSLVFYTPYLSEMRDVVKILAKFNQLDIPIVDSYDSWGSKNLVREYAENGNHVSEDIQKIIFPIVQEMKKLDISTFSKGIIHGDLQRKHVLKSKEGAYCLLDMGCIRKDAKVFDLSIFLAWFCLGEETWDKKDEIIKDILKEYTKINPLSQEELVVLPMLVQASYAAYLLKTSVLLKFGDTSEETRNWHDQSLKMLKLFEMWNWKI
ncbi:MAG TPA: phosphotransferase [Candidatus Eisenbacteria bacterium]|nr:phosphotransferase [Candidatus Eisenbacteria bacterium]